MGVVRWEYRREKWRCFYEVELLGDAFRHRYGLEGDYPAFDADPFDMWAVCPRAKSSSWVRKKFASSREAKSAYSKFVRELRVQSFEVVETPPIVAAPPKKTARPKGLAEWKAWWEALPAPWQAALRRSLPSFDGPPDDAHFAEMARITHLILTEDDFDGDLGPIARLKTLEQLDLYETRVKSLAPLVGLTKLESLDLYGTGITDLRPLARLTNLRSLRIANNSDLCDLRPLLELPRLTSLDVSGTGAEEDLRPLKKLKSLATLVVSQNSEAGKDIARWSKLLDCDVSTDS